MNTQRSVVAALTLSVLLVATGGALAQDKLAHLTTQDYIDLQQLYARYNMAIDSGDGEAWAATFTPDGVFNTTNVGHDALVQFVKDWREKRDGANRRHANSNLLYTPTDTGARGTCYLILLDIGVRPAAIAMTGVYDDVIVRTPRGWRFTSRTVRIDPAPAPRVVAK
jgi:hypothetical protein